MFFVDRARFDDAHDPPSGSAGILPAVAELPKAEQPRMPALPGAIRFAYPYLNRRSHSLRLELHKHCALEFRSKVRDCASDYFLAALRRNTNVSLPINSVT